MKKLFILVLLSLVACQRSTQQPIPSTTPVAHAGDKELHEIVHEFYADFPNVNHKTIFGWGTDASTLGIVHDVQTNKDRLAHGACYTEENVVVMNAEWWETANIWYRRIVVYHELGHCVLGLHHPDNPFEYTIMNSILSTVKPDGSNWRELVTELKVRAGKNQKGNGTE